MHSVSPCLALAAVLSVLQAAWPQVPDLRSVAADLSVPALSSGEPAPGKRVPFAIPPAAADQAAPPPAVLYLPENYDRQRTWPLIVEFPGNGGYRSAFGDQCDGRPEGCCLGYGISAGQDYVWLSLPFLTAEHELAERWWGSPPDYSPEPTVGYTLQAVDRVCDQFNIDREKIILCGFSRGAIACNFIGLHNGEIARLWTGFVAYSHYDGARDWKLPGGDRDAARRRLERLGLRPQFICHESDGGLERTRQWLETAHPEGAFTFVETGFRNHNAEWLLRPSPARQALRRWLAELPPGKKARTAP